MKVHLRNFMVTVVAFVFVLFFAKNLLTKMTINVSSSLASAERFPTWKANRVRLRGAHGRERLLAGAGHREAARNGGTSRPMVATRMAVFSDEGFSGG